MKKQNGEIESANKKVSLIRTYLTRKVMMIIIIIVIIAAVAIGLQKYVSFDSKTTKLGFEDIGQLATQSAYCTRIGVIEDCRQLFGVNVPFTQSEYIYSYDIVIKAGYHFENIEWSVNNQTIEVKLPEAEILSNEINMDSLKIYHEAESIFSPITMTEQNEALKELKKSAVVDAIENGLFENARSNAEIILRGFISNAYDLEKYKVVFKDK